MQPPLELVVAPDGKVRCVYSEAFPLTLLGTPTIVRASSVEPDPSGNWHADLSPVRGPTLGPFPLRSMAVTAEVAWLNEYVLSQTSQSLEHVAAGHEKGVLPSAHATKSTNCSSSSS